MIQQQGQLSPADYRANASECRRLAYLSSDKRRREQCLKLAASWDDLAGWREVNIAKRERITEIVDRFSPPEGNAEEHNT